MEKNKNHEIQKNPKMYKILKFWQVAKKTNNQNIKKANEI